MSDKPNGYLMRFRMLLRRVCSEIIFHPDVESFIFLLIGVQIIVLSLYNPLLGEREGMNDTLWWMNLSLTITFTVEMGLKIIALGGLLSYLSDPWNVFDGLLVLVGWTQVIPTGSANTASIRALRALRPLRAIARVESLKAVLETLYHALPMLASVLVLLFVFMYTFSLTGVYLFDQVYNTACYSNSTGLWEFQAIPYDDPDEVSFEKKSVMREVIYAYNIVLSC